jgi:predicted phosphodiesterase
MPSWWCKHLPDFGPLPVGLMADSHGDAALIALAVDRLRQEGCTALLHLGDICDSALPRTADACVSLLKRHAVLAVCGNNDHALVAGGADMDGPTLAWLQRLPLAIETPMAVFVHSRADVPRLGRAAMIGDMDDEETLRFMTAFPGRLLFRGHSHRASIRCLSPTGLIEAPLLKAGDFSAPLPGGAVITCGSLCEETAWIWYPLQATLRRLSIGRPDR